MLFTLLMPLWLMVTPLLRFGVNNDKELSLLNVFFAARLRVFLWLVWLKLGLEPLIVDGIRTDAEQAQRNKEDPRNPKEPGKHGTGEAADLNFKRDGVIVVLKASSDAVWQPIWDLAEMCGIKNGSKFKGYRDANHFYV
jgi:hypothetical protein